MRGMKRRRIHAGAILLVPAVLLVLMMFMTALSNLESGRRSEGREQLEDAVRRAAVACYAAEGIYPPDVEYLEEHYGIQVDRDRYTVVYDAFASNLMPDVTVLENG